jgi:GTPase SAR1 family protein
MASYVDALTQEYDVLGKVLLIGDSGVGKSSIVQVRYRPTKHALRPSEGHHGVDRTGRFAVGTYCPLYGSASSLCRALDM